MLDFSKGDGRGEVAGFERSFRDSGVFFELTFQSLCLLCAETRIEVERWT
jgi:hypothetical protein